MAIADWLDLSSTNVTECYTYVSMCVYLYMSISVVGDDMETIAEVPG